MIRSYRSYISSDQPNSTRIGKSIVYYIQVHSMSPSPTRSVSAERSIPNKLGCRTKFYFNCHSFGNTFWEVLTTIFLITMIHCTGIDIILSEFFEKIIFQFWVTSARYSTQRFMLIPNMCVLGRSFLGRKHALMALVLSWYIYLELMKPKIFQFLTVTSTNDRFPIWLDWGERSGTFQQIGSISVCDNRLLARMKPSH